MNAVTEVKQVALSLLKSQSRVIVAVYGPQGSGKTTCTRKAAEELNAQNIPSVALSIDDFYLPHADLQALASQGNPLLQFRGLPGTHDTGMMIAFLNDFLAFKKGLTAPVYDKSLNNGRGDRSGFNSINDDVKVLFIEGWMIGFQPIAESDIVKKLEIINNEHLIFKTQPTLANYLQINENLKAYIPIWHLCTHIVRLQPLDMHFIYKWRTDQEHGLIKLTGSGLTDEQVKAFVDQYWGCYILYADSIPSEVTCYLDINHTIVKISK